MSVKLKTASNGSVTLAPEDTASDVTLTVPALAGSFVTANASGNVGINEGNPSERLQVVGNIRATGVLFSPELRPYETNYSAQSTINVSDNSIVTLANGGFIDMASYSGFLVINSHSTGDVSIYVLGAGFVSRIGGSTGTGLMSVTFNPGISGYTIQNFTGGTVNLGIVKMRTRGGA
jgi:hypothetical protein